MGYNQVETVIARSSFSRSTCSPLLYRGRPTRTFSEHPAARPSLHDLRSFLNSSLLASFTSASTNESGLGPAGYTVDLERSESASRPQIQPTVFSGGSSAASQFQLFHSTEASTLETRDGEEATETLVEATTAQELGTATGNRSAAPLLPTELTSRNDSPNVSTQVGMSMVADQAAAAGLVQTANVAASLASSPPHVDRDLQETPVVGARIAGVLTYRVPEKIRQRGHTQAFKHPQPDLQPQSQPPTSRRESADDRTPNRSQPSQFSPTANESTEENGPGCSPTSKTTVAQTGGGGQR